MVDIAYLGFGDGAVDLTTLPLAERRALLDAPNWPFDGMNEAGVAVGMAAVPQADERHDPGKPAIDSLRVMRLILDRAGNVDEAIAILTQHNIAWEGGPPLHYLVADRSGRAALVEFHGGRDRRAAQRWPLARGDQLHAQCGRGRRRGPVPSLRHPSPTTDGNERRTQPSRCARPPPGRGADAERDPVVGGLWHEHGAGGCGDGAKLQAGTHVRDREEVTR